MRRVEPWLVAVTAAAALAAGASRGHAQVRDHRAPPPPPPPAERDHRHPPPGDDVPREAPPPPREERIEARAGFVFITGRWNWSAGKWEWLAGHWERERAGKHWTPGRWDRSGDRWGYVEGSWVDGPGGPPGPPPVVSAPPVASPPPPPPAAPPPDRDDHRDDHREHRDWTLDRPVVSSYWPVKGKIGSRIVIRGRNFPTDAVVLWNGNQVTGARVDADRIVVAVPPGATSGALALRTSRRDLPIGSFEVANYDADAEARRIADDERRRAEQDWADRQKQLAHDRAARQVAFDQAERQRDASREQRREDREKEIRGKWETAFLGDADTQAELTLHAQRVAELTRAREVAELADNGKLVVRITVAQSKEDDRHQARMTSLHDAFGRKP